MPTKLRLPAKNTVSYIQCVIGVLIVSAKQEIVWHNFLLKQLYGTGPSYYVFFLSCMTIFLITDIGRYFVRTAMSLSEVMTSRLRHQNQLYY